MRKEYFFMLFMILIGLITMIMSMATMTGSSYCDYSVSIDKDANITIYNCVIINVTTRSLPPKSSSCHKVEVTCILDDKNWTEKVCKNYLNDDEIITIINTKCGKDYYDSIEKYRSKSINTYVGFLIVTLISVVLFIGCIMFMIYLYLR